MIFPQRLRFRCPFCRRVYARSRSKVLLGPGSRKCDGCHQTFADGSVEWPSATWQQKREYLLPSREIGFAVGNWLFGVLLSLAAWPHLRDVIAIELFTTLIVAVMLLVRATGRLLEIRESMARYQRKSLAKLGYSPTRATEAWPR